MSVSCHQTISMLHGKPYSISGGSIALGDYYSVFSRYNRCAMRGGYIQAIMKTAPVIIAIRIISSGKCAYYTTVCLANSSGYRPTKNTRPGKRQTVGINGLAKLFF